MNAADVQYLDILQALVEHGEYRDSRSGPTYGLFGAQMRFKLKDGFPLLTTKKVHLKSVIVELLWFLRGSTNIKYLNDHGVTIWDEWADEAGELGPVYGAQWRSWSYFNAAADLKFIDQIHNVITGLRDDPGGRRHIVSAWNPVDINAMALPPCHCLFQFHVAKGKLSCHLYQRSADWFLGVPFNIASYALLTHLVARELRLEVGDFIHSFGDYHLYANHVSQARQQLAREPLSLPKLLINPDFEKGIFDLEPGDITVVDYQAHPAIAAPISI